MLRTDSSVLEHQQLSSEQLVVHSAQYVGDATEGGAESLKLSALLVRHPHLVELPLPRCEPRISFGALPR
jgi:hypothetical protein